MLHFLIFCYPFNLDRVYQCLKSKVTPPENLDMIRIWVQGIWVATQEAMESKESTLLKSCLLGIVNSKKDEKQATKHDVSNFFIVCLGWK